MERLTDHTEYCIYWSDCDMSDGDCIFNTNCYDRKIYNKLREYEDLEEQGLLLKLPNNLFEDTAIFIVTNLVTSYRKTSFPPYY